jgi:ABC-type amino acid transport substrate-binding protein
MGVSYGVFTLNVIAVLLSGWLQGTTSQTIHVGATEWPPFLVYSQGQTNGILVDILQEVSVRTGYPMVYHQLPQRRVYEYFEQGIVTLEPGSNPAWRREHAAISCYSVPYYRVTTVILAKKGRLIRASGPPDFQGVTLGGDLGFAGYGEGFDEAFASGAIRREDVTTGARGNILKLVDDRVQGVLVDRLVGQYTLSQLGLDHNDFEEVYQFNTEEYLFFRFHKAQEALLPRVNAALLAMQADGTIQQIVAAYSGNPVCQ